MDALGLKRPMGFASSCFVSSQSKTGFGSVMIGKRRPGIEILSSGFCDKGHLKYYSSGVMSIMSGKQEKMGKEKDLKVMKKKKKQLKLLKGLYKDLSSFSEMGFGLESNGGLIDQVKSGIISEATENLLEHLQKLKAEEKEVKKKLKEEKARLKATRMQNILANYDSTSSSSESSDSECDQVLNMKTLKRTQSKSKSILQQVVDNTTSSHPSPVIPEETSSSSSLELSPSSPGRTREDTNVPSCSKKIEVCMGGKCKKSGAGDLLEEFQRAVGIEGAVTGCKCMGKCRDGPNVKVVNGVEDDSVRVAATTSLCLGVALEDVNMIVADYFGGQNQDHLGFASAA